MKIFDKIILSDKVPEKNCIWVSKVDDHYETKIYVDGEWVVIGFSISVAEKIKEELSDSISTNKNSITTLSNNVSSLDKRVSKLEE